MIPLDWQPETMIGPGAIEKYRDLVNRYVPLNGRILEIGSFHGGSIVALAGIILAKDLHVVACDMFEDAPNPAPGILSEDVWLEKREGMLEKFNHNIWRNGLRDHVTPFKRGSAPGENLLDVPLFLRSFDLIFIDGGHTYPAASLDILESTRLVTHPGVICGHDYCKDFPGVVKAVDEIFGPRPMDPLSDIWVQVIA
jgi:predicted O-methyltransferase YrrM